MGDIAMEDPTDENPPELEGVANSGVIFVLQLENWAVPSHVILVGLAVAVDEENHEGYDVYDRYCER